MNGGSMNGGPMGGSPSSADGVLMAVLMALLMGPLLAGALPLVVARTLPGRRRQAIAWFSTAYLTTCFAGSLAFLGLASLARTWAGPATVIGGACLFAVAWQLSGIRLRLVDRCG